MGRLSGWLQDDEKWTDWQRIWGNHVMSNHIMLAQDAVPLQQTEGLFQGWQLDRFRGWDTQAAPVISRCPSKFIRIKIS